MCSIGAVLFSAYSTPAPTPRGSEQPEQGVVIGAITSAFLILLVGAGLLGFLAWPRH